MERYMKLITYIVGIVILLANDFLGISELVGMEDEIFRLIMGLLTGIGVWGAPNNTG